MLPLLSSETRTRILAYLTLPNVFLLGNLSPRWRNSVRCLITMSLTPTTEIRRRDETVTFSLAEWKDYSIQVRTSIGAHVRRLILNIPLNWAPMLQLQWAKDFEALAELNICLVNDWRNPTRSFGRVLPRLGALLPKFMSRVEVLHLQLLWPNDSSIAGSQQEIVELCCAEADNLKELIVMSEEKINWSTVSRHARRNLQSFAATNYFLDDIDFINESIPHMQRLQRLSGRFVLNAEGGGWSGEPKDRLKVLLECLQRSCQQLKVLGIIVESGTRFLILPVLAEFSPSSLRLLIIGLSDEHKGMLSPVHKALVKAFRERRTKTDMLLFTFQTRSCTEDDLLHMGFSLQMYDSVVREDAMLAHMCGFGTLPPNFNLSKACLYSRLNLHRIVASSMLDVL